MFKVRTSHAIYRIDGNSSYDLFFLCSSVVEMQEPALWRRTCLPRHLKGIYSKRRPFWSYCGKSVWTRRKQPASKQRSYERYENRLESRLYLASKKDRSGDTTEKESDSALLGNKQYLLSPPLRLEFKFHCFSLGPKYDHLTVLFPTPLSKRYETFTPISTPLPLGRRNWEARDGNLSRTR